MNNKNNTLIHCVGKLEEEEVDKLNIAKMITRNHKYNQSRRRKSLLWI